HEGRLARGCVADDVTLATMTTIVRGATAWVRSVWDVRTRTRQRMRGGRGVRWFPALSSRRRPGLGVGPSLGVGDLHDHLDLDRGAEGKFRDPDRAAGMPARL